MENITQNFSSSPEKKKLVTAVFVSFVCLSVFLAVEALSAIKEFSYIGRGVYASNVITVMGKGEALAIPDIATFSFSVVETGKTVGDAQDKSAKKINSIIDTLKQSGIDEKDIKTTNYSSYPKYEWKESLCPAGSYCPPSKQVLVGYEVTQSVTVKVRKTADAGAILTKVGGLNVSNISGLDFVVDDIDTVQAEARDKAITDAKEKAKVLAKSLGIRLKRIVNFYEGNIGDAPVMYSMEAKSSRMGSDVATPPQLPTGENTITSNVSITYEVE
jgi:uncharacterized protein